MVLCVHGMDEAGVRFPVGPPSFMRAYSKVVLRGIRIAEARVRFSLGPPIKIYAKGPDWSLHDDK